MKKKYIVYIVLLIIECLFFSLWFSCRDLQDQFHYSAFDVKLQLEDQIHTDQQVPLSIVRMFHNKFIQTPIVITSHFLSFFDIHFLLWALSPVGLATFVLGVFQSIQKKNKWIWSLIVGSCLLPLVIDLVRILPFPTPVFLGLFMISCSMVSLYGSQWYLKGKKRLVIFALLCCLSLLYLIFLPHESAQFCYH